MASPYLRNQSPGIFSSVRFLAFGILQERDVFFRGRKFEVCEYL